MNHISIPQLSGLRVGGLLAVAIGTLLIAERNGRAQPPDGSSTTVESIVKGYTMAPMGEINGVTLDDGTILHWPAALAERFTRVATKGDRVRATGWVKTGPNGEMLLEVQRFTNLRSNVSATNEAGPPAPVGPIGRLAPSPRPVGGATLSTEPARGNAVDDTDAVEGVIKEMTSSAPKGKVTGAVLNGGTVLRWPVELADQLGKMVSRGDRVRAVGRVETGPTGSYLEVQQLTRVGNLRSETLATPAVNLEQRVRTLEDQIEQMRREIDRLRR